MTNEGAQAGWYPDPSSSGWQRYFDGTAWTELRAPPPGYAPPGYGYGWQGRPPWKGAQLGLPASGPGALAHPARRLGARALDGLVLAVFIIIAVSIVAPRAGPIFPKVSNNPNIRTPTPGFVWIELAILGCVLATGIAFVLYETVATARYGRTLGKAWLHIRPVRTDLSRLGWGRSFCRIALYWLSGCLSWIGLLDPLWCLWDDKHQFLHDKAVDTIVINDIHDGQLPQSDPLGSYAVSAAVGVAPGWWQAADGNWYPPQSPLPPPPTYGGPFAPWASVPVAPRTNGLAVASLVCSLVGILVIGVPAIVGVALGFVSRSQIRGASGSQTSDGLALAGIIVGFVVIGFWSLIFIVPRIVMHA